MIEHLDAVGDLCDVNDHRGEWLDMNREFVMAPDLPWERDVNAMMGVMVWMRDCFHEPS